MEAAIGPMSTPVPNEETGERDLPPGRAAAGGGADPGVPPLRRGWMRDGQGAEGAGRQCGGAARDDRVDRPGGSAPGPVRCSGRPRPGCCCRRRCCAGWPVTRRWSRTCSARAGEDLDLGRVVRLFTRAQRRRLWRRDRCMHLPRVRRPGQLVPGAPRPALGRRRACPTSTTPRCSASGTTPWCTSAGSGRRCARTPDELGRYVVWDLHRRQLRPAPGTPATRTRPSTTRHH